MERPRTLTTPFGEAQVSAAVTHTRIEARSPLAADWALGWWHAHTGLDEALFARDLWRGALGTGHKPQPARTELDAFVARWSFASDLALESARLPAAFHSRLVAYCGGFNQAWKPGTRNAPWSPEDCHLLVRTLGFFEWWETRAPQTAFLLEAMDAGLPWAKVLDLWPGLGPEPERGPWSGLRLPPPLSPGAWALVQRLRRFRPGSVWALPAHRSSSGRPLLAAAWVTDVTEPGLPLLPVRVDVAGSAVRGLSRPGHPGFLAGRTRDLAWVAVPAVDDGVDLRVVEGPRGPEVHGSWAGAGRTGSLQGLLELEGARTVEQAREATLSLGSACLDLTAADSQGAVGAWAQGPRWLRPVPRDGWLPSASVSPDPVGPRKQPAGPDAGPQGRLGILEMEAWITRPHPLGLDGLMAPLRFLLPDTDEGLSLRRWTGRPAQGPEAEAFDRVLAAVLDCFWETSPRIPDPRSPLVQSLLPAVDRLVQAPHSAWFPSPEKNRRLAEAVRRAFTPGYQPPGPSGLGRRAPRALWNEVQGERQRVFAATVALCCDLGEAGWRVFLTDDETEVPSLAPW